MASSGSKGNKKRSSPSDEGYWKRAQMGGYAQTHKDRNHKRHNKRMGLVPSYQGNRIDGPDPKAGSPRQRVSNPYGSIYTYAARKGAM